jgi:hypothetical protein
LPLPPPCHCRATTAYKIKEKYVILLTYLIFHHNGNGSKQQPQQTYERTTAITIAVLLLATRIALMFGSDKRGVGSGSKPY